MVQNNIPGKRPRILITNDDGVGSEGICAAYECVKGLGDIYIVAPASQKSGVGRSISIFDPLRMRETVTLTGVPAFAVGGTPTDSVALGINLVMRDESLPKDGLPDLVISGFNIGENVSTDSITTSGTIGAALEAASYGIPSVAVSLMLDYHASKRILEKGTPEYDSVRYAVATVRKIIQHILTSGLPPHTDLLNINIPQGVTEKTPVTVSRLSRKYFTTKIESRVDPKNDPYYWISGGVLPEDKEGTDVNELYRGHITMTPVALDATVYDDMAVLKKLSEELTGDPEKNRTKRPGEELTGDPEKN
ncbi:MAG: 5'/3'-nucleotidase SurE [Methanosarcinaceae archaeon]|jgi:5'-nucleotidase|nr:5'/3'-nucleotidase SurE [Methanosarcinaceae archaeon]